MPLWWRCARCCPLRGAPGAKAHLLCWRRAPRPICCTALQEVKSRGNQAFALGDYALAVRLYKRALEAGGTSHVLHSNLAACYLACGHLMSALEAADAAVSAKADWAKAHYRLGSVYSSLHLWAEAYLSFSRAVALEPRNAQLIAACAESRSKVNQAQLGSSMCFTWGRGEFGALGHRDVKDKPYPRMVESLRHVVDSCGAVSPHSHWVGT